MTSQDISYWASKNPNQTGHKILWGDQILYVGDDYEEVLRWGVGHDSYRLENYICTTCGRVLHNDVFTNLTLREEINE